ncbi:hypothetical protein AAES_49554 [Amazona aestiva]|uniref:Uncharacterized protein n=1 Tax=Amazona aestiva TaxID=12930 RepID=A0A0Q3MP60_AMAAE|nr:hypothetical protein AAES_49554 [Amazona aestiva]
METDDNRTRSYGTTPCPHPTCLYISFCLLIRTRKTVKMTMANTNPVTGTPTATPTLLIRELQALSWYQNAAVSEHLMGTHPRPHPHPAPSKGGGTHCVEATQWGPYVHSGPCSSTLQVPKTQGRGSAARGSHLVMQRTPVAVRIGK